ncbi:hypothetical protein DD587_31600, partial [Klebsiella pneumoniae]
SYVQDTLHIITKLRTKFLKSDSILPLGNYVATVAHLEILVKNYTKYQHMLTITDLKAEDKMNYAGAEKMCSPEVKKMIADNIDNSAGTVYLKLMYLIPAAFLDKTLSIVERIYKIWYCIFFLRIWKKWIKDQRQYTVKDNFLSSNCYTCVELN